MKELGKKILKDVSRSFYLSIRVLPRAMREPIGLGYLLARASDTLADTESLPADVRAGMLGGFAEILNGGEASAWLSRVREEVMPLQVHEGERALLANMRGVFDWLDGLADCSDVRGAKTGQQPLGALQHAAILNVMKPILRGQQLDIERFELRDDFRFECDAELEEYCYLVAGCVGEFWTDIGQISRGDFSLMEISELRQLGANYGKGLQLINILRDVPSDLENGRCYLPGVDISDREAVLIEAARWRARARRYIADGQSYAGSLTGRRTRLATALPGLIGERTLDMLDVADWDAWSAGVKVSRSEIYRCAWDSLFV